MMKTALLYQQQMPPNGRKQIGKGSLAVLVILERSPMIYTEMTGRAMRLAYQAHHGQTDKAGIPYIFHPIHVAEQMTDENATIAALLHDVIEDTPVTMKDLEAEGFPQEVLDAVAVMTRIPQMPYMEYIAGIRENPLARRVKMADLRHNMDISRLPAVNEEALWHTSRYRKALEILEEAEKQDERLSS